MEDLLQDFFVTASRPGPIDLPHRLGGVAAVLVLAAAVYLVCAKLVFPMLQRMAERTKATWDDHIFMPKVLRPASLILPVALVYYFMPLLAGDSPTAFSIVDKILLLGIVALSTRLACSIINSFRTISSEAESLKGKTLNGVYQTVSIVVICVALILAVSIVFEKRPSVILTGLGASAAILMLVFKDSIMGLVAGIQINVYDLVRPGDWIIMDKRGANGLVSDVTLNFIKVRNWDNSIVTIPTYAVVSESFQNMRGMWDENGRRIRESVIVDVDTIKALTAGQAADYALLIEDCPAYGEGVTNLFFYRYYLERRLRHNAMVTPRPHLMVRQMPMTAAGLPVEIYCFTTATEWTDYEHVKAEIVETALASVGIFGLRVHQQPSGEDVRRIGRIFAEVKRGDA